MAGSGLSLGVRHGEPVLGDVATQVLSLVSLPDARFEISASGRPLTITVTAPPTLAGVYPVTPSELTNGPVNLRPPQITAPASPVKPLALQPGFWLRLGAPEEDVVTHQWYADGVAVPGAKQTTFLPAPGTQTVTLVEILALGGAPGRTQPSAPFSLI